jgi:hypothetical protein
MKYTDKQKRNLRARAKLRQALRRVRRQKRKKR